MKTIDFSFAGGFPLTQQELDYLQRAYTECITAIGATGATGLNPAILTGMQVAYPGGATVAVTDGWLIYNGELMPFTGSAVTPTGTDVAIVQITSATTSLIYNDGSSHPAIGDQVASLTTGPALTTTTAFPLSAAQPFQYYFGLNGRESAWSSINVSTSTALGGVYGTIDYKKNWLNNTLHLKGTLNINAAQNFSASPGALFYLMGTLPAGYWPANSNYFTSYYHASNMFKDDLGVSWIKQLTSVFNSAGQIQINFIRPDIAVTGYSVVFNTIVPLD